ncbi:MAG: hypothetical protein MJ252_19165 [archaeon]|nr:hypothetical protein [archaeon]
MQEILDIIRGWDLNGKPITFYYETSTQHKTLFGALLSTFSFFLMSMIATISFLNFFLQKPSISSNRVFYINKRFLHLENLEIKGSLRPDVFTEGVDDIEAFLKYFRLVFYENDEFDQNEFVKVIHLTKDPDEVSYSFRFDIPILDVFKDKEFSVLGMVSCRDIKQNKAKVRWENEDDIYTCNENVEEYFEKYKPKTSSGIINNFILSFNTPIYSIDKKGNLQRIKHETEFPFAVKQNTTLFYSMETKYVVIEKNTNLVFSGKKYESYVVLKNPQMTSEPHERNGYTLLIELVNFSSEEIIQISISKYKLLEVLSKLGGLFKIITFMKMSCKFWTSYLYETSLYRLVVTRKNKYLDDKRKIIETSFNSNDKMQCTPISPIQQTLREFRHKRIRKEDVEYTSYFVWFANRFCKRCYLNKEAKFKRDMLCEILGMANYLLHLDWIDRQILLEHKNNRISKAINDILINNEGNNSNEEEEKELQSTDNNYLSSLNSGTQIEPGGEVKEKGKTKKGQYVELAEE